MINAYTKTLAAVAVALGAGSLALANPIPIGGSVDFFGHGEFVNSIYGPNTALAFQVTNGISGSGDYTPIESNDHVTFATLIFNPPTAPVADLWTFTDPGTGYTYSFVNVGTPQFSSPLHQQWTFDGVGYATITGNGSPYAATDGTWSIVSNSRGTAFTFTSVATVPDASTTALLVGLGLAAVGAFTVRSRMSKKA
jgi:hypothetical protein